MSIDTPKVSIVTLLGQRSTFIPLLKYCVQYQTYPESSIEWIILDDGPLDRSDQFNDDLATYVRVYKKLNIGRKRQIACDLSIGEFIIFFDDVIAKGTSNSHAANPIKTYLFFTTSSIIGCQLNL